MTRRIVRLPAETVALAPNGRRTTVPAGDYPIAELDGTASDGTQGAALYVEDPGGLVAISSDNLRHVRDEGDVQEYGITITESVDSVESLADLLDHIADQLREGYTSGFHPGWELKQS